MKEYEDLKTNLDIEDYTKNYKYYRELDVPGWEKVRDEMFEFTTKTRPEISLGMGKPIWRRCWPEPYVGLRNLCPTLWDMFEPLFGEIRSVGFFVMLSRDCSIHTDNYDAVGDGLPEATKRINIPIQNCDLTHTRWFVAHDVPSIASYDGVNKILPIAKPIDLKKMENAESLRMVMGTMYGEHLTGEKQTVSGKSHIPEYAGLKTADGKKVFVPDGTHYNTFDEKDVTEVSRVELKRPTIIRVNEPHQVVIDEDKWRFPRVAATIGFKDEDRLTI